jgi:UDP-N-acetylbacillosamine N-acetyltransferase
MNIEKIIIIGAFHEIIELAEECGKKITGIIDNKVIGKFMGYTILGTDEEAINIKKEFKDEKIILSPDSPAVRKKLFQIYSSAGWNFGKLISPKSRISKGVTVEEGVFIHRFVNISNNTKIGRFVRLNVFANVMHDCKVGSFSTVAPNAVVLGNINIGEGVYIGANSTILPGLTINDGSIIGAGSVVTKNISFNLTVFGNPARSKQYKKLKH